MQDFRAQILNQMLPLVVFDGWSEFTLREAAKGASLDTAATEHAFPRGALDCIDYFYQTADAAMKKALPLEKLQEMRFPDRIEALLLAKLHYYRPYREALRRANAQLALPWNAAQSAKSLYRSVDLMWKLAGDRSADFSFYTKRATLALIYSSMLLFWLNDESGNETDTKEFLRRRLQNVADFGKWKKNLQAKFSKLSV